MFIAITLNQKNEIFIVYIISLTSPDSKINICPFCKAQIGTLFAEKTSIVVPKKDTKFADIFFIKKTAIIFEHTKTNNHIIKLIGD